MHNSDLHNEQELIKLFQHGDRSAATALYGRFYKGLVYFARRIVEHAGEAEDIAQDSMVKLFGKKNDFSNLSDIKSFLYVSVRNACFNYLKARDRHELSHRELRYLTPEGEESADLEMLKSRVLTEIYHEVAALPTQCGEVFRLVFIHKFSTAEAAERLGISPQTVLNQKARAIKLLRYRLSEKGFLTLLLLMKLL